ncbi:MAG: exosortase K [Blastocatellia bacterium]|nr:exosortase K [Blastocatellia bacterium]
MKLRYSWEAPHAGSVRTQGWNRIAQFVLTLVCAFSLKWYYSAAGANQLRWILAPTAALVEAVSGVSFEFESGAGYLSADRHFLIAASCAGVNFLITAFLMISLRRLLRNGSPELSRGFIPAALATAYLATLVANTVRIAIALRLQQSAIEWLDHAQLHRLEGIVVYFGFLLLLFLVDEMMDSKKEARMLRSVLPLAVYYAMMLGIPLLNGAWRQGTEFWEHSLFVLLIPLLLIIPVVTLHFFKKGNLTQRR